jgi:hypothetical protein
VRADIARLTNEQRRKVSDLGVNGQNEAFTPDPLPATPKWLKIEARACRPPEGSTLTV